MFSFNLSLSLILCKIPAQCRSSISEGILKLSPVRPRHGYTGRGVSVLCVYCDAWLTPHSVCLSKDVSDGQCQPKPENDNLRLFQPRQSRAADA